MVEKLGGKVYPGKEVVGLIEEDETLGKRVKGVRLAGGDVMRADLVVVSGRYLTLLKIPVVIIDSPCVGIGCMWLLVSLECQSKGQTQLMKIY